MLLWLLFSSVQLTEGMRQIKNDLNCVLIRQLLDLSNQILNIVCHKQSKGNKANRRKPYHGLIDNG